MRKKFDFRLKKPKKVEILLNFQKLMGKISEFFEKKLLHRRFCLKRMAECFFDPVFASVFCSRKKENLKYSYSHLEIIYRIFYNVCMKDFKKRKEKQI